MLLSLSKNIVVFALSAVLLPFVGVGFACACVIIAFRVGMAAAHRLLA